MLKRSSLFFLCFLFVNITYATCLDDFINMKGNIAQYKSITTVDGHNIDYVDQLAGESDFCYAKGNISFTYQSCILVWKSGDWGNTVYCTNISG